ncbi:MAG: dTDP-glucose 4,6-dehydratase [Deltaproteobacteria bacterium]|nr:MAG: dTDP-glucose 4,6-dehydratase [Deltaproteobacteria bacterium]
MSRLLITGGAGFIGSNFVHYWLDHHLEDMVVVLDSLTYAGNRANLALVEDNPRLRFIKGDILDQDLVEHLLRKQKLDTIVHFAAESHVDRSIHGPDTFIKTNIIGTHSLLKAAKAVWIDGVSDGLHPHRFHHISTDEVYGSLQPDAPPFTEESPYAPNSPYAASKAASDHLVRAYHHTYGLCVTMSNCSNNYGPYQFPEKLIPFMLTRALAGDSLPVYGDGLNIRDWLYVKDHCRAVDQVVTSGKIGETYNIGGNNEQKNIDVVKMICRLLDETFAEDAALGVRFPNAPFSLNRPAASLITFVKDRQGHDRRYAIDTKKSEVKLNFKPKESFETGIRHTIRWYLDNEPWWRSIMDGSYRKWINRQYNV